jgi:hypothetical protein
MRRGLPMATALLILLICAACSGTIRWEDSIEAALTRSERDGRPVMLYFTYHG